MSTVVSLHVIKCYDWNPMQSVSFSAASGYDWNENVPHRQYSETVQCVYPLGSIRNKERKKEILRHKLILIV